jgi:hypothetical protein
MTEATALLESATDPEVIIAQIRDARTPDQAIQVVSELMSTLRAQIQRAEALESALTNNTSQQDVFMMRQLLEQALDSMQVFHAMAERREQINDLELWGPGHISFDPHRVLQKANPFGLTEDVTNRSFDQVPSDITRNTQYYYEALATSMGLTIFNGDEMRDRENAELVETHFEPFMDQLKPLRPPERLKLLRWMLSQTQLMVNQLGAFRSGTLNHQLTVAPAFNQSLSLRRVMQHFAIPLISEAIRAAQNESLVEGLPGAETPPKIAPYFDTILGHEGEVTEDGQSISREMGKLIRSGRSGPEIATMLEAKLRRQVGATDMSVTLNETQTDELLNYLSEALRATLFIYVLAQGEIEMPQEERTLKLEVIEFVLLQFNGLNEALSTRITQLGHRAS